MTGDVELLEALRGALMAEGWCAVPRYHEVPGRLRVWHPSNPVVGETVNVACERDGLWFRSSTGALMARRHDIPGAVAYVERELGALVRPHAPV
ncbi:hypothetical protein [Actinomadura rugatobispora]|uniref:DUF317 domain-containing protein n=1 Tax=Actinomadura rugatobispora TaxID=1994 RepID=A0ABW1A506_9ACTN|nr:hypothetical protein GCM10010200_039760 [Actinomadura rugatobispora]